LELARTQGRFVHPQLHDVCQLIAVPISIPAEELAERGPELTADPAWRASAAALLEPIARHVRASVPIDDPQACDLLARDLKFEVLEQGDVKIKLEHARFDLDACASERAADGSCESPSLDPQWTRAVRSGEVPGLRGPFWTRFGLHLALVPEVLPSNMPSDDGFEQRLREAIHPEWQAKALQAWIAALRTDYAAQLVTTEDHAP
ncbi:MAG: hypothetical protein IAG13_18490, partial [Deltaproteobacteria bacterium]|nr:hypothetical protein [Nannocystaceae bacterium]